MSTAACLTRYLLAANVRMMNWKGIGWKRRWFMSMCCVYVALFLAGGGASEAGGPTGCGEVARGGRAYLLGNSV